MAATRELLVLAVNADEAKLNSSAIRSRSFVGFASAKTQVAGTNGKRTKKPLIEILMKKNDRADRIQKLRAKVKLCEATFNFESIAHRCEICDYKYSCEGINVLLCRHQYAGLNEALDSIGMTIENSPIAALNIQVVQDEHVETT